MKPAYLLQRLAAHGRKVVLCGGNVQMVVTREGAGQPPGPLLEELREHREAVVAFLSTCELCGRDTSDDEDRERMADLMFCQQFGSNDVVTKGGRVEHDGEPRCPFKAPK